MRRPNRVGAPGRRADRKRRRERRKIVDRRLGEEPWSGTERRATLDRRDNEDRRIAAPSEFYAEEVERIKKWLEGENGTSPAHHVRCPRCSGGHLVPQKPIKWAGGITVWEIRCTECPRIAIIRSKKVKWQPKKPGVWKTLKDYMKPGSKGRKGP